MRAFAAGGRNRQCDDPPDRVVEGRQVGRVLRAQALALVWILTGALLLVPGSGRGSSNLVPTQPTPHGPIYAGVPGALPPTFTYRYNGLSPGWPVRPRSVQHPIRGAFIDPRGPDDDGLSGYHFGIDINVDDDHPDTGAPPGLSHRVYALDSGIAYEPADVLTRHCVSRRMGVGHFAYWHVSPIVSTGQRVRAGQQIAWTCRGIWHVHLSEWQRYRGARVWVDPLHRGGALRPYTDTAPPVVSRMRFVTPPARPWRPTVSLREPDSATPLPATGLHGQVELRVRVADPQSFLGFLSRNPAWPTDWTPYELRVRIRNTRTGRLVLQRTTFRADQMPQTPYLAHYAPGTVEDDNMQECVGPPALPHCDGIVWLRPFSRFHLEYWDTRTVANGTYSVTVDAHDIAGNVGSKTMTVRVRN
jgi:hypothetical protein